MSSLFPQIPEHRGVALEERPVAEYLGLTKLAVRRLTDRLGEAEHEANWVRVAANCLRNVPRSAQLITIVPAVVV
jgi:hypothetical protein